MPPQPDPLAGLGEEAVQLSQPAQPAPGAKADKVSGPAAAVQEQADAAERAKTNREETGDWLTLAASYGKRRWPGLDTVVTDQRREELADAASAVLDKHRWGLPAILSKLRAEITLIRRTWALGRDVIAHVRKLKAERDNPQPAAPVAPVPEPQAKPVRASGPVIKANS